MSVIFRIIRFDSSSPPAETEFKWDVMGGTMGRSSSNDWVLPDANRHLSGRHAVLRCQNGDYYITDTSTNGVFINQKPVPLGRDNSARLEQGDTLKMGGYVMEVVLDSVRKPESIVAPPSMANSPLSDKDNLPKRPTPGGHKVGSEDPLKDFNDPFGENKHSPEKAESASLDSDFWNNSDSSPTSSSGVAQLTDDPFFSDGEFLAQNDNELDKPHRPTLEDDPFSGLSAFHQPPNISQLDNGLAQTDDLIGKGDSSVKPVLLPDDDLGLSVEKVQSGVTDEDPFDFSGINDSNHDNVQRSEPENPKQAGSVIPVQPDNKVDVDDPFDFSGIGDEIALPVVEKNHSDEIASPVAEINHDETRITEKIDSPVNDKPKQLVGDNTTETIAGNDIQKLLVGMGITDESERSAIAEHVPPEKIGQLFRILLQGSMDVLRTRTEIKSEMRMDVTTIQPIQNNPVKFSVNVDDALLKLLMPQGQAFMSPELALAEAFDDIKAHQVAVIAGVQASLKLVMKRFDPEKLVERLQKQNSILTNILPNQRQARLWGLFEELYSTIEEEAADDFQRLFGLEFSQAYEKQIEQLEMLRRN